MKKYKNMSHQIVLKKEEKTNRNSVVEKCNNWNEKFPRGAHEQIEESVN